jgi:Fic-DOC domain mobile mystery protein B
MKISPGWALIPGETPLDDISGLLVKDTVHSRRQLNQVEAENITVAAVKYLVGQFDPVAAPFTFDWMFKLHREMFGKVWAWAGKPRECDLNLGCKTYDVEPEMMNLAADLQYWGQDRATILADAALLHYRAVKIHPFLNGNGRWSRMLANIWLRKHGVRPTVWPDSQMGETSPIREEYLAAIRAADSLNFAPLTELHRRYTPS